VAIVEVAIFALETRTETYGARRGRSPKIWGGSIRPPNISRTTVIGCDSKYEV